MVSSTQGSHSNSDFVRTTTPDPSKTHSSADLSVAETLRTLSQDAHEGWVLVGELSPSKSTVKEDQPRYIRVVTRDLGPTEETASRVMQTLEDRSPSPRPRPEGAEKARETHQDAEIQRLIQEAKKQAREEAAAQFAEQLRQQTAKQAERGVLEQERSTLQTRYIELTQAILRIQHQIKEINSDQSLTVGAAVNAPSGAFWGFVFGGFAGAAIGAALTATTVTAMITLDQEKALLAQKTKLETERGSVEQQLQALAAIG